jgi:hypothetical protein
LGDTPPAVPSEVPEASLGVAGGVALAGRADDHGVDVCEADIVAIEAVGYVDLCKAGIVVLDESDINALGIALATTSRVLRKRGGRQAITYREEGSSVNSQLDDLNRGVVAHLYLRAGRQRDLRQAHGARIGVLAGSENLEWRYNRQAHVRRTTVWPVGSESHVDIKKGRRVSLEPSRLEGDGTASYGPVCPVLRYRHSSTRVHPLHAIRKSVVCDQVVASPARICDDSVC